MDSATADEHFVGDVVESRDFLAVSEPFLEEHHVLFLK